MRRALVATWLSGSATGVLLGLFGVQLVTSGITVGRVSPLSHPEVLSALQAAEAEETPPAPAAPAPPPVPAPTVETAPEPPLPDAVSQPADRPPASPPPRPGAQAVSEPKPPATTPPAPPAPPPTVAPPAPVRPAEVTTTTAPKKNRGRPDEATTTTITTPARDRDRGKSDGSSEREDDRDQRAGATTETIASTGGAVAVRYENGKVRLAWARPNPGYNVRVEDEGPRIVAVRFRSSSHVSRVWAFYKDGKPSHHVREDSIERDDDDWRTQDYGGFDRWWWRSWD